MQIGMWNGSKVLPKCGRNGPSLSLHLKSDPIWFSSIPETCLESSVYILWIDELVNGRFMSLWPMLMEKYISSASGEDTEDMGTISSAPEVMKPLL